MLAELTITNFAIIEHLHLRFASGLSIFTGETGAGKSIIIDAVSLLLGGRADSAVIRTGARQATVEGIFYLSPGERATLDPMLQQDALQNEDPNVLILAREIRRSGHNICRVNGRAVRLSAVETLGRCLVDIHGQSEHLSLLYERAHLDFLDRYGGLQDERAALSEQVHALRELRRELADLSNSERELSRRVDLLRYQIDEIRAAHLQPGEDESLVQERNRLANAEKLMDACSEALSLLSEGGGEQGTAADLLGQAVRALSGLARIDPQMEAQYQLAQALEYQLDDLIQTLRDYQGEIEFNPSRLNRVEERLNLIRRLQRKYGDGIEDVLAFGEQAAAELERIEHSEERIAELQTMEGALLIRIGEMGAVLSAHRREAGAHLAAAVEAELNELRMEGARFGVDVSWAEKEDGARVERPPQDIEASPGRYAFDASGLDRVAFLIAPNIGEPLKPMAKVASGGETSRLMLALKTALSRADQILTLIFDEIDQGIGGRVGGVVGLKLRNLSRADGDTGRQVFCVTHLPQLAGYADVHLHVRKTVSEGRTKTVVEALDGEARIRELAQMLGGESDSTRQTAIELLALKDR
ncbi:MAG: DNA repair protein RecN [Anaerolineae bacterium]|nr:DNA repair protein RecN [Anaerolineae bacterium]